MAKPTAFEGPIPGQSLTSEPKNFPWEQPPQYADPMDALEMYMKRLSDSDVQDDLFDLLDVGIPISIVTSSMLSQGVMDGLHSVDVKLLLKGVVATQIQTLADVANVSYKVSMEDYGDEEAYKKAKMQRKLEAKLAIKSTTESNDPGVEIKKSVVAFLEGDMPSMETVEPMEEEETPVVPTGIMSKDI